MKQNIRISVCIPTYNGEEYIHDQLSSILSQLGLDDEVVISDDSSSDRTLDIINLFKDPRIRLLEGNTFRNPIYNFENALKHSKGRFIFCADQDDVWLRDKVEVCLNLLKNYDIVVSDCFLVDKDLTLISKSFFQLNSSRKGFFYNLKRNSYLGCCMAFKREILDLVLPFPPNIPMHDIWIGFVGALFYKTIFTEKKLIQYRRHGNNASPTAEISRFSIKDKIMFRMSLCSNIFLLLKRYYYINFKKR